MNWWQRLVLSRRLERELDAELRHHLDCLVDEYVHSGLSREEARRRAQAEFGGLDQVKEYCRDARGTRWVGDTAHDIRFAVRLLVRDRRFIAAAVVALALGIAAASTVFTIANALVIRGLPVEHASRIMYLGIQDAQSPVGGVSYLDYLDWRASQAFTGIAAFNDTTVTIRDPDLEVDRVVGTYVSRNSFELLAVRPILGRDFLPEDDVPAAAPVTILGYRLWTRRYSADRAVIGRMIEINGVPASIIGVMPDGFAFPFNTELWQPLSQWSGLPVQQRDRRVLELFGRLKDGITIDSARADLSSTAARLEREYPDTNRGTRPLIMPFTERYNGSISDPIYVALLSGVAFVLLIVCANVANLLLARAATRAREITMRLSLGATRWRIVRQLLVESLLISVIAGCVAIGLSIVAVRLVSATAEGLEKPYWIQFTLDWHVFAFLAVMCIGTGFAFGLVPALHVSRPNGFAALRSASGISTEFRARRWASALVTAQIALTLVLLTGAGLMARSGFALYRTDLVIDTNQLLTGRLALPVEKYSTPDQRRAFADRLQTRLNAISAIPSVTIASAVPLAPAGRPRRLSISGDAAVGDRPPLASVVSVGDRYFETLGLHLLHGRTFSAQDGTPGHENAIVNQRFAAMYFHGREPLGRRIEVGDANALDGSRTVTIIGISPSVRQNMGSEPNPVIYVPYRAEPAAFIWVIVRNERPEAAISLLREEVRALDPDLPLFGGMTMNQLLAQTMWPRRAFSVFFVVFAGIALVLASVGLYAVTAYAVARRTQELGIRMALGARPQQVRGLVMRQTTMQLGLGALLGVIGAFGIGKLLQAWLVQTSPTDPHTLIGTTALLGLVCFAAALRPAQRATRIDPLVALRCE